MFRIYFVSFVLLRHLSLLFYEVRQGLEGKWEEETRACRSALVFSQIAPSTRGRSRCCAQTFGAMRVDLELSFLTTMAHSLVFILFDKRERVCFTCARVFVQVYAGCGWHRSPPCTCIHPRGSARLAPCFLPCFAASVPLRVCLKHSFPCMCMRVRVRVCVSVWLCLFLCLYVCVCVYMVVMIVRVQIVPVLRRMHKKEHRSYVIGLFVSVLILWYCFHNCCYYCSQNPAVCFTKLNTSLYWFPSY